MQIADRIFICVFGPSDSITEVLSYYSETTKNFTVLSELSSINSFYEFPTLAIMHQHSQHYHPNSSILYLHTKGTTAMQDDGKSFWRDSMLLWNVGLHTYQRQLLNEGWYTSGLLFRSVPWPHYSGNFFWAQSGYLSGKPSLDTLIWYWRYGAERWLLSDEKQFCRNYRAESIVKQFPFPPPGTSLHDLFSFVEFNKSAGVDFFC
jgi:hypothetical protein